MNAKSYVPSSGRMYLDAIASMWFLTSRAKSFSCCCALDVVLRRDHALEVVERELGVDRDDAVDLDHGVDALAAREAVLERVGGRRKPVGQEVGEQELAEPAARLRRPQRMLEALEVVRAREDLLVRAAELAELAVDVARRLRRAVQAPVERRGHRLETPVDLRVPFRELRAGIGPKRLQLRAQAADEPDRAEREAGESEQDDESDPHRTAKR